MNKLGYFRLIAALSSGLFAGSNLAQTSDQDQRSTNTLPPTESLSVSTVQVPTAGEEQQMQYATALDGTGLISMDSTTPTRLLLGAAIAGGWDSNPDNLGK